MYVGALILYLPIRAYDAVPGLFGNTATNEITTGLYMCASEDGPTFYYSYGFWLPVTVYDGILCLFALWYGVSTWMSGYCANGMNRVHIVDALVKGNMGYFFRYARSPSLWPRQRHDMTLHFLMTASY